MIGFVLYFCLWLIFAPVAFAADWTKVRDLNVGQQIRTIDGWEKIETIEFLPPEPVFDIQIANTQNFVGNGIVAHNTRETFKQRYHWGSSVIDRFSVIDKLKLPIDDQTTEIINGFSREIKWRATAFDVVLMTTPVIGGIILMSLLIAQQPISSPAITPTQMPTQSPTVIPTQTPVARVTEAAQSAISVLEKVVILSIPTLTTWQPPVEVKSLNIIEKSTPAKPVIPPEAEGKPADISRTGKGDYKFYVVWDENKRNSFVNSIPLNSFASPGTAAHSEGAIFTGVLAIDNLSMYGAAVQSDGRILLFEADGNPHHQGTFFTLPSGMRVEKMNWGTGLKQNNLILTVSEKNGTKSLYEITNAAEHDLGKYPKGCTQAVHPLTDCMMWYNRLELPKTLIKLND